jgi:hypothetical protein
MDDHEVLRRIGAAVDEELELRRRAGEASSPLPNGTSRRCELPLVRLANRNRRREGGLLELSGTVTVTSSEQRRRRR